MDSLSPVVARDPGDINLLPAMKVEESKIMNNNVEREQVPPEIVSQNF
jgi:hypothetical protein